MAHFVSKLFFHKSFCVQVFGQMGYPRTKIQKVLFSILVEVTRYVGVLKNIDFLYIISAIFIKS